MVYSSKDQTGQLQSVCKPRTYSELADEVNRQRGPAMPTDADRQRLQMKPETQVQCCDYFQKGTGYVFSECQSGIGVVML